MYQGSGYHCPEFWLTIYFSTIILYDSIVYMANDVQGLEWNKQHTHHVSL
jgi:hypothetical protein